VAILTKSITVLIWFRSPFSSGRSARSERSDAGLLTLTWS